MCRSYAIHSASVCFNGGVKVKRQPWNILSLTFLVLLLSNVHVIVWQRGGEGGGDSMWNHPILSFTIRWAVRNLLDYNVRAQYFDAIWLYLLKPLKTVKPEPAVFLQNMIEIQTDLFWYKQENPVPFTCPKAVCSDSFTSSHLIIPAAMLQNLSLHILPQFPPPDGLGYRELLDQMTLYVGVCLGGRRVTFMRHSFSIKSILVGSA